MTDSELTDIRARLAAATPGPWADMGSDGAFPGEIRACADFTAICRDPDGDDRPADRAFIANAPSDIAALLAEVDRLRAELAEAEATHARPVLAEIHAERVRQDAKWGEQNHPDGTGPGVLADLLYRCTTADAAKGQCERAFARGTGTYAHIMYEEVCEAFEEHDLKRLRAELVQVAAVAVAWVEKLDRDMRAATAAAKGGG